MVKSGIKAEQQGRRSRLGRRMAVHALRFASILVGAGLILRAGASERAMSAVDVDDDRSTGAFPALPKRYALAMPQPAFGRADAFAQQAAFAVRATALKPGLAAPAIPAAAAPAAPNAALVAVRDNAAKASVSSEQPGLAVTPALSAGLPSPAAAAVVPAASLLQAAPAIVPHPTVGVASPAATPTVTALVPPAQPLVHPVTPGTPSVAAPVAAPALALPTQAAPVAGAHPRQVSQPSDLETVLHSPASAWDYAEAVPDELRGTPAVRQSYPAPAF